MKTDREDGFPQRMIALIDIVGSVTDLARKSRLSRRVIDNYKAGLADPSRSRLIALASAAGVSVEWLATGEGPMRPDAPPPGPPPSGAIDSRLLARVHQGIAEAYKAENVRIYADPLADEVARIYADLVATYDSPEERLSGLKLALHQLRRSLQAPGAAGSNSKQVS